MYADTITLFNRYSSSLGDVWYPTVLHNVDFNADKAAIIAKYGAESQDTAKLHVRYTIDNDSILIPTDGINSKPYLLPKEWEQQSNDDLPESITFTAGQDFDFFWHGEWSDTTPIADSDYETGSDSGFYDYMNRSYDEVFVITSVAQYSVIPHFEVMAQ